jgi:ATP-dependent Clp protease protease subunit
VCQRLDYFNNQSDKPIFLVIDDCPGGSAIEGFQIVQAIKRSKAQVHVVVKRMAASMAAIIATLADHSYCYPDALILHHQASAYLGGTGRDMEDQMRQFKEISHRLIGAVAKKLRMSEKEFVDQMYKNRSSGDWELFGDEAVDQGWVEHVATTIREEGVRTMPKGMRSSPTRFLIAGEKAPANAQSNGYLERYEVQLKEELDAEGKRHVRLPRLSPLDAYLLYNPDGYYR